MDFIPDRSEIQIEDVEVRKDPVLKQMIKDLTLAINKYYAFGSCFSDDN